MKYWGPINSPGGIDGNDSYINANPAAGIQGSIPTFQSFEQPLRGLQNLIVRSNFAPNAALDDLQISQAVRSQWLNWAAVFGGTANALTAVINPVPGTLAELTGMPIRGIAQFANTGAVTLTVNDLGERPITRTDLSLLTGGEILPNSLLELVYDGTRFQILGLSVSTEATGGLPLTNPLTLYVRTDGNDTTGDGSADTPVKAFKTGQAAMNRAFSYGPGEHGVTIKFADGLYQGNIKTKTWAGPDITIDSTSGGFSTVHLQSVTKNVIDCLALNKVTVKKVKISALGNGVGHNGINSGSSTSLVVIERVEFGRVGFSSITGGGAVVVNDNISISGGGTAFINFGGAGTFSMISKVCTITTPVTFTFFVDATAGGVVSSALCTFTGSANVTGQRFEARHGGGIDTLGAGINYFPGTTPGVVSTATMGWYN